MDSQVPETVITNVKVFADGKLRDGAVAFNSDGIITNVCIDEQSQITNLKSQIINGSGAILLPGAIDAHVHFREPGLTEKADIWHESRAAAAGGVTYVMDMPNCKPTTTTLEALRQKEALFKENCVVNYGLWFGITNDNIDEALAIPQDEICGYKVFLGSSTGGMLMNDAEKLRKLFSSTKRVIAVHSESEDIIRANRERYLSEVAAKNNGNIPDDLPIEYHPLIRSREACVETTKMAISLAEETGANLHVCHITTADELELLRIREENISAEVCVSHLWFTNKDYARLGTKIKCNPAIKTASDREALRRALSDDTIDTVATDHAPHLLKDKEGGALKAASGMPSIQYSYLAMLELVYQDVVSLETVIKLMCENPAKRFGLTNRGKIAPGYAADFVLVQNEECLCSNMTAGNKVKSGENKDNYALCTINYPLSKCGWSPFEGETFHNKILSTWVNGKRVY